MTIKIILLTTVFLNVILSFFVISQNPKSINNRFFALLSFAGAIWTFSNYMTGIDQTPLWLESTYAFGSLVIGIGITWILVYIDKFFDKHE